MGGDHSSEKRSNDTFVNCTNKREEVARVVSVQLEEIFTTNGYWKSLGVSNKLL